jgi:hypothetical protein
MTMAEIHDSLYSYALLAAFVCGTAAALWDFVAVVLPSLRGAMTSGGGDGAPVAPRRTRGARVLFAIAVLALLLSVLVHVRWGHGPGSPEPMPFGQVLSEHPAFFWAAVILLFAGFPAALIAARERERRARSSR